MFRRSVSNLMAALRTQFDRYPDDILRVRLQTLGVVEHSFNINLGGRAVNWLLYDVGGAR
jgi:hypothetical protein